MQVTNAPAPQQPGDDDIDLDLLDYLQTLTPAQRLERHEAAFSVASRRNSSRVEAIVFRACLAESLHQLEC